MKTLTTLFTVFFILGFAGNSLAFDMKQKIATSAAYFDVATGHRYIKNLDGTYTEYTKRGRFFRGSVPNDLPLLTTNKYIRPMGHTGFARKDIPADSSGLNDASTVSTASPDKKNLIATGAAYYDIATGHKYVKDLDGTYTEYTKRGRFFRGSVPNDLPLLTTNKYIRPMGHTGFARKDIPADSSGLNDASTVSTASPDKKNLIATGAAYYDIATGHKYVKDLDGTYTEFTKRGKFFRGSVPNDLPLLTTNKYIRGLEESCYLLYERTVDHQPEIMVLPSGHAHPKGWKCKKILVTMK